MNIKPKDFVSVEHALLSSASGMARIHPNRRGDLPGVPLERKGSRRFNRNKTAVDLTFADGSIYRLSATKIK